MQALGNTPPDPNAAHAGAWQEAKKEYDSLASEVGTAKLRHFEQTQREQLLNTMKQAPELLHKAPQVLGQPWTRPTTTPWNASGRSPATPRLRART